MASRTYKIFATLAFTGAFATQAAEPTRLTVAPKTFSPIVVNTLPNATCVLHAEGQSDPEHTMKVFAGEDGTVRFQVRPSAESDKTAVFALDCTAGATTATFPLELNASYSPTAEMPTLSERFNSEEFRLPASNGSVRPALSEADALRLSPADLASAGYPKRPDAEQSPEAFAKWLKAVTNPSTFIPARLSPHAEVTHRLSRTTANYETTSNWSGFELRGGAGSYVAVNGQWNVPNVTYETNHHTYSAYWIGLDGDGTNDLVQAGTEQEITDITLFFGIRFDFTSYYAWTEFLPQQGVEQVISNFPVSPGDEIICTVSMGGNFFLPELSGPDGIFNIENVTKRIYTSIATPKGSTSVGGSEAEWIMERPTVNNALPDLADYSYTYMYEAMALSAKTYNWVDYDAANYQQIFMYNGNDLLSGAYADGTSTILFFWFGSH
ncbi:MAG: hypothetical protein JO061_16875 [Acidobacteriaceae bacterium]|nr:hypothetical protein [Acidobacteriaceae bacterium]